MPVRVGLTFITVTGTDAVADSLSLAVTVAVIG